MRFVFATLPMLVLGCSAALDDDPGAQFGGGKADGFLPPLKQNLVMERAGRTALAFSDASGNPVDMIYAQFALSGPATVSLGIAPHDAYDPLDVVTRYGGGAMAARRAAEGGRWSLPSGTPAMHLAPYPASSLERVLVY
jgi:hypothetical protein